MEFEWDDTKAASNLHAHGVSFAQAAAACRDPFAIEWIDDRHDYSEERIILLGMKDGQLLAVVYTERNTRLRIISARRVQRDNQGGSGASIRMRRYRRVCDAGRA
jgi:uncharacterized protein